MKYDSRILDSRVHFAMKFYFTKIKKSTNLHQQIQDISEYDKKNITKKKATICNRLIHELPIKPAICLEITLFTFRHDPENDCWRLASWILLVSMSEVWYHFVGTGGGIMEITVSIMYAEP